MFMNPHTSNRVNQEFYEFQKPTDYDMDKERWSKQMTFHTMDCVLDLDISQPSMFSFGGLRKTWKNWLTMRKIVERRPGFDAEVELKNLFIEYRQLAASPSPQQEKSLCRYTTFGEATRIAKEAKKEHILVQQREEEKRQRELSEAEPAAAPQKPKKKGTWSSMAVSSTTAGAVKQTAAAMADDRRVNAAAAAAMEKPRRVDKAKGEGDSEDVVLDVDAPLMEMQIEKFRVINVYMGQMTSDDWVQMTTRIDGKLRSPKTAGQYESFTEYPVFEVKLGDGVKTANTSPFIVVAVMDKDGARYGKDGQDAAMLRKALAKSQKSWFGFKR